MYLRLLALVALLVPARVHADTADYKLLGEGLAPPGAASEFGVRATLPEASRARWQRSWRDQGSALQLRGLVCIEHVFVDDATSTWMQSRRKRARATARKALAHLRHKARNLSVPLEWQETQRLFSTTEEISVDSSDHAWTEKVVQSTSAGQGVFLPRASCPVRECDQRLAILHVMKPGRSYALPSVISLDKGVERVVMFMRRQVISASSFQAILEPASILVPEVPGAFVHEILHIFGAEDLYQPAARLRAAQQRYPDDVMLQSHRALESLSISDYTAYYIGWREQEPPALPFD